MKYCVYLTRYKGDKLPPYYIGSTSVEKANSKNYFGTVCSIKWKKIFVEELLNNKHLFSIEILSLHQTRTQALKEELRLHILHDVVKSKDYFNEALATPNGMFGRDVSGANNPMFGKNRPDSSLRMSGNNNIATREDVKAKLRKPKANPNNWLSGRKMPQEIIEKVKNTKLKRKHTYKKERKSNFPCEEFEIRQYVLQKGECYVKDLHELCPHLLFRQIYYLLSKMVRHGKIQIVKDDGINRIIIRPINGI